MDERLKSFKHEGLVRAAGSRELYDKAPVLKNLFYELTCKCNEHCFHCGSRCNENAGDGGLKKEDWLLITDEVKESFEPLPMLCITGGEPMLCADIYDIMGYAAKKGFSWGMTTNATLIGRDEARRLKQSGMKTVSVSIDGLEEMHDKLRGLKGGFECAMEGLSCLIDEGFEHVQVTTVINHENIGQLDELFELMKGIDIDSWRVINLEPIGRALDFPERMLTAGDHRRIFDFIREKREAQFPVRYGCAHYLGYEYERDVREWFFMCTAGRTSASIMWDGSVGACLDIERSPRTIQGSVTEKSFTRIWREEFGLFRQRLSNLTEGCDMCPHLELCAGGSCHSFDYESNEQRMCFKDILF